ncbi:methyltransferase [Streptomyces sp. NPDC026673]|uniref:methyltransferase n=1 Tax=Streptomyces sp. NPDC026673 TaxID=3155724 RepID=UPI0033CE2D30
MADEEQEEQQDVSLWRLADLVTPMALRTAATLNVADHLADGPRTATELAQATGADSGALDRLLRYLTGIGVFGRDAGGRYALTARGAELRSDHPGGLRDWLDTEGGLGRAELSFVHLPHGVRTGTAAFPLQYGRGFWEDLAADPERTRSFDRAMGVDVAEWAAALIPAYDWAALGHVVDVGGGNGTLLAALLTAFPGLRGTVLDQPATAAAARGTLEAAGLAGRGDAVEGSFFDALPKGAGGYLLCAILHDWDDDSARAVLRRCAEAAGEHGRVIVVEKVGADHESTVPAMDLRMLVYFGGRERGVAALTALGADAGLRVSAVRTAGDIGIVEFTAA